MSEPSDKNAGGRTGSNRLSGLIGCLCICATITFVAWLAFGQKAKPASRLWIPVLVATNGNFATIVSETRRMEFWTPSAKTKDYVRKVDGKVDDHEQWQVMPDDEAVLQFGTLLHSNKNVLGYRRVEAWGQGRTSFKPGWWWSVNVYTNYTAVDMAHVYQQFWKSSQPTFIEVIDNRGGSDN